MTTTVQPGTGTPDQVIKQSKPGTGAGSATPIVRTVLFLLCCLWMLPVFGLLISSFRTRTAQGESGWWTVIANPLDFTQWTVNNYAQVLGDNASGINMGKAFINSFVVTVPATIIPILIAAFAAYAFTFMEFKGKEFLFIVIVGLLVVPNYVALVPMLKIYGNLGIGGTFPAAWLAHIGFGMSLAIYIFRNYMSTLPRTVFEAAQIDGASHYQTFYKLILPMSVPALASFAIFQFLWVWNDLLIALVFVGPGPHEPITVAVSKLLGQQGQGWNAVTAAGIISMLLPLVVFLALQRFFVRGLTAGSVKG